MVVDIRNNIVSLEQFQARHNNHIAAAGNSSASLDPHQQPHDANDLLIKGAGLAAAGRELGLSEEETLAAVSRSFRRQQTRDGIAARRSDRAQRESQWSQKQASLGDWGDGEIKGVGYEDDDELARAFGEDQSDYQVFQADDRGFTEDEETGLLRRENFEESRGEQYDIAPKSALKDALTALNAVENPSPYGYDQYPGGVTQLRTSGSTPAAVAGRLEDDIRPDTKADAALGAETVRRDNQRFDDEAREASDWRAAAEADIIARDSYTVNGSGAMADEAIGRIAEIRKLGASGMGGHAIGETAHVVRTANDAIKGQAMRRHDGVFLDPVSGDPIAIQGPELPAVLAGDRTPNDGSSSNALNAPQTAREWVQQTMPDYRESQSTFGDFPQVDITLETTNLNQKVQELGRRMGDARLEAAQPNVRSIEELQSMAAYVQKLKEAQGSTLMVRSPETGKNVPANGNLVGGLMQELRLTSGDEQRLANAMYQMDAARRSSVNENPTGTYLSRTGEPTKGVTFDAPEAVGGDAAPVAMQKKGSSIRVGTEPSGKPIRQDRVSAMKGLQSPDAQKPYIGQVKGEEPRINRFRPGNMGEGSEMRDNLRRQAEERAKGKPIDEAALRSNQVKATLVEEREKRDKAKRTAKQEQIRSFTPANLRQRGRY